jgi:Fe2+ transport system protein FeoA
MTVWDLIKTQSATVQGIDSDLDGQIVARLHEMGISSGRKVTCLRKGPLGGPIVMQFGGSVFALEHDLANRIQVQLND